MPKRNAETPEQLSVTYVPIAELRPASYNPRKHDEAMLEQLKTSIQKHGLVEAVIVNSAPDRKGIIIGGHGRVKAAQMLGMETVPVVYVNIPDIEKEKALNLRLNRVHGEFVFEELRKFDLNLLLETGFDNSDFDKIFADTLGVEDDGCDIEKMIREIKTPISKFGDLYALGQHRILCGDALDLESVKRLVDTNEMDMVTLDPIYGIGLSYDRGVSTSGKYGGAEKDDMKPAEYRAFLEKAFVNALAVSKQDLHFFCWNDQTKIGLVADLMEKLQLTFRRTCLWIKPGFTPTPNVAWHKSFEPCMYSTRGNPWLNPDVRNLTEILNKNIDVGNRTISDIIDVFELWMVRRVDGQSMEHPTQKDLELYEKPLRRCTKVGANVLDLFSGSGTCLLACEQMKRCAFVMEKDPIFVDVCLRRFEEMTGIKPEKLNK